MLTKRPISRSIAIGAAAACLTAAALAGTPGDILIISDTYYRIDRQLFKVSDGFARGLPKTVNATVRKLAKADAKGKPAEALTIIANTAIAKMQLKSDKAVTKLFAINDAGVARLTELEAQVDFLLALSFTFTETTSTVLQGASDATDAINTALANEIAD